MNWHNRFKVGSQELSPFELVTFVLTCLVILAICGLAIWGDK